MNRQENSRYRMIKTSEGQFAFVAGGDSLLATFLPASQEKNMSLILERFPGAKEDARLLPALARAVADYYAGRAARFDVPIDFGDPGSFHRAVYEQCRRIPCGATASYRDLARAAGNERAVRAVGNAMAKNRWPLVVPCHRVLRADGSIGGFSSPEGVEQKRRMLRREGVELRNGKVFVVARSRAKSAVA